MRRMGVAITVALGVAMSAGCNRQDAEALSNIGQILVQCAKALPINSPQKVVKTYPPETDKDASEKQEN